MPPKILFDHLNGESGHCKEDQSQNRCHGDQVEILLPAHFTDAHSGVALSVPEADRMKPGEVVQALEANIVAVVGVRLTGIP